MSKKLLAAVVLSLTLTGCISPSTYHPYNGTDGYQQIQMNRKLWEIRYTGNQATPQPQVHNMMLYRAAEIARNHRFRFFRVLSQRTQDHRNVFVQPGYSSTYVVKNHHQKRKVTEYNPPTRNVSNSYTTIIRIRLQQHGGGNRVYNARTLKNSLASEIAWRTPNS